MSDDYSTASDTTSDTSTDTSDTSDTSSTDTVDTSDLPEDTSGSDGSEDLPEDNESTEETSDTADSDETDESLGGTDESSDVTDTTDTENTDVSDTDTDALLETTGEDDGSNDLPDNAEPIDDSTDVNESDGDANDIEEPVNETKPIDNTDSDLDEGTSDVGDATNTEDTDISNGDSDTMPENNEESDGSEDLPDSDELIGDSSNHSEASDDISDGEESADGKESTDNMESTSDSLPEDGEESDGSENLPDNDPSQEDIADNNETDESTDNMDENLDAEETIDNNRNEMGDEDLNQNRDGQDESHDLMENHDMGLDGYRDDRIKEMYDFTNQNYDRNTQEWKEAAYQQYQNLEKQKNNYLNELNSLPNDQSSLRTRMDLEDKIHNINWQLNNDLGPDLGDYKSSFRGFNGNNDFDDAFASFNTDVQGNKDPNIQGDCGIISSQNVANQQLGTHGSELDGINHMRNLHDENGNSRLDETGKPSENGATGFDDRKAFLNSKGIDIEDRPSKPLHRIDLNDMSSRFQNGDSCMLRIKGSDLSQPELANRTERVYNPNSGKIENVKNNFSNHSVTVAGFTHDDKGNCTGIYVNDTGRYTPSNRVYISADKFNQMQKNTKGFGVEYCRRH